MDIIALHAFAEQIGVRRCWYHAGSRFQHYDITAEQRDRAIQAGAHPVTYRSLPAALKTQAVAIRDSGGGLAKPAQ